MVDLKTLVDYFHRSLSRNNEDRRTATKWLLQVRDKCVTVHVEFAMCVHPRTLQCSIFFFEEKKAPKICTKFLLSPYTACSPLHLSSDSFFVLFVVLLRVLFLRVWHSGS